MNLLDEEALAQWAQSHHTSIDVAWALFEMADGDDEAERIWSSPTSEEKAEFDRRVAAMTMTVERAAEIAAACDDEDTACYTMIAFCDLVDGGAWGDDFIQGLRRYGETSWADLSRQARKDELVQSVSTEVESQVWHELGGKNDSEHLRIAKAAGYRMRAARKLFAQ